MIRRVLILGATGDLTLRYLLPALVRLREAGKLPEGLGIACLGRDDRDTEGYLVLAKERLACHAADLPEEARSDFVKALTYHRADVTDPERLRAVLGEDESRS